MGERINPASIDWQPIETPAQTASRQSSQAGAASSAANTEETRLRLKYLEDELKKKAEKAQIDIQNARLQGQTLNEGQGKATNFYQRTYAANKTFDNLNLDPDSFFNVAFHSVAPGIQSHLSSDERNLARDAVTDFLSATLRLESGAAIGPQEFIKQYQIYFPSSGAGPKEIAEKKRLRQLAIKGFASEAGPVGIEQGNKNLIELGYMTPPKAEEKPAQPSAEQQPATVSAVPLGGPHAGEGYVPSAGVASSEATTTAVELPPEGQQEVMNYINSQRAAGKRVTEEGLTTFVNGLFKKYNLPGQVAPGGAKASVKSVNEGGAFGGVAPAEKPLTTGEKLSNKFLQNPLGGAVAGGVTGFTAGLMPEAVGLLDKDAQQKMERSIASAREVNPGFTAGEFAGQMYGTSKLGGLLSPAMKVAGVSEGLAPSVANMVFGTTQGAAEAEPGDRWSGAARGFGLSALGELAPAAVSRVLKPNTSEDVAFLRSKGVTLTPGQTIGGRAARLEEMGSNLLLGGGDIAIAARKKAFDDFNRQYLNEAGSHIGFQLPAAKLKPTQRMKMVREAFDNAYDNVRSRLNFVPDQQMSTDLADFEAKLGSDMYAPENANRLNKLLNDQVLRRVTHPSAGGADYKELSSILRKRRDAFARAENWELVDGVDELQAMVDGAARRNSPADVVEALDNTDKGYAYFARAQDAGRMAGSEPGAFTPAQLMSVERRGDTTVRGRAFNEGDTLAQQWADSAQKVMGNLEPNSGTAARLAVGAPLTGASVVDPTGAGYLANILLGVSNTPGIKQGITAAIAGQRPKLISDLGELMQRYQPAIGSGISAALREKTITPEHKEYVRFTPGAQGAEGDIVTALPTSAPAASPAQAPAAEAPAEEAPPELGGRNIVYDPATKMFVDKDTNDAAPTLGELMAKPVKKAHGGRVKLPPAKTRAELFQRYAGVR
jgi:hypothetical protein